MCITARTPTVYSTLLLIVHWWWYSLRWLIYKFNYNAIYMDFLKKDKLRILLTGNRGFIARKVEQRLKELGHEVVGFDILDGFDLLDRDAVEKAVQDVDAVLHVAAEADMTRMVDLTGSFKGTVVNVDGTHNVAYACAKHGKWLIYTSTCCVYGNVKDHPEKEDTTLPNPSELYACSKYAGEWIVWGYGLNYSMPWTILRYATIYGEGMREALGVFVFFKQAMKKEPITVHGDGKQERTLTFVDDLVEGTVAPFSHKEASLGQIFNLSTTERVSAIKMATDIKALTGSSSEITFIPQRKNQTILEDVDASKAERLLGWKAATPWDRGLAATYEWMKTLSL